jgi:hypothetical protein
MTMKAPFPYFGGKSKVADAIWARLGADAEQVAYHADWPVNEIDLHARHAWLYEQAGFRERMRADPEFFDAKVAGWWVWGISQWIGSGWCACPEWTGRAGCHVSPRGIHSAGWRKRPNIKRGGVGVHRLWHQKPNISGADGASGQGIFSGRVSEDLYGYFEALATRLRRVRSCCGDWQRVLCRSTTTLIGTTAVFLDPPYSSERNPVYAQDSMFVAHEVREWALRNGNLPAFRIALCGYDEHDDKMPAGWTVLRWKTQGGYANAGDGRGRVNAGRETIWFSPHCLPVGSGDLSIPPDQVLPIRERNEEFTWEIR